MAEGVAPYYVLQNYGTNRNCTLTASFPAVIAIEGIDVGGKKGNVNYDVSKNCCHVLISSELSKYDVLFQYSAINLMLWIE